MIDKRILEALVKRFILILQCFKNIIMYAIVYNNFQIIDSSVGPNSNVNGKESKFNIISYNNTIFQHYITIIIRFKISFREKL